MSVSAEIATDEVAKQTAKAPSTHDIETTLDGEAKSSSRSELDMDNHEQQEQAELTDALERYLRGED